MNEYHRVHRLTPLLQFWSVILALLAVLVVNLNLQALSDIAHFFSGNSQAIWGTLIGLGIFVVVCLLIWWVSGLWWRRMGYMLSDEELSLRRGLISTQLRTARYDRTQAVDVVEPLIARIFGLAAVRVETAGGNSSSIEVAYLRKDDAEQLRRDILKRVAGEPTAPLDVNVEHQSGEGDAAEDIEQETGVEAVEEAPRASQPQEVVSPIPTTRTLASEALRFTTFLVIALFAFFWWSPLGASAMIAFLVGSVPAVWGRVNASWRYNANVDTNDSGDRVLNIAYGLADSVAKAFAWSASMPWRSLSRCCGVWPDGTKSASTSQVMAVRRTKQSGSTRILPVGNREQAMRVYELVSPLTAEEIEAYAQPEGHTQPTYTSPRKAWWASPIDRAQQAVTLLPEIAITHDGRLSRRVAVIETSHIQELTYKEGPIDQLLGLASVRFELVTGPVGMMGRNLLADDADDLLQHLRQRDLPELNAVAD
ncbi:Putative membrane protein [Corynebacterium camporealensis]|uniref:PH domain-containing protein n=1 Tax=Corynebacterium camporealensis TaxID=161896 RepID=UPI000D1FDC0E|nr:Putative membrane protein [Corynebacterium camporealensis]